MPKNKKSKKNYQEFEDISIPEPEPEPSLFEAIKKGLLEKVEICVLKEGSLDQHIEVQFHTNQDKEKLSLNPLEYAIFNRQVEIFSRLVKYASQEMLDKTLEFHQWHGANAYFCREDTKDWWRFLKILMDNKAPFTNINYINKDGNSLLHLAAKKNQKWFVIFLLNHPDFDKLNYRNNLCETALFIAAEDSDAEIVRILLEAGAADLRNNIGRRAVENTESHVIREMMVQHKKTKKINQRLNLFENQAVFSNAQLKEVPVESAVKTIQSFSQFLTNLNLDNASPEVKNEIKSIKESTRKLSMAFKNETALSSKNRFFRGNVSDEKCSTSSTSSIVDYKKSKKN